MHRCFELGEEDLAGHFFRRLRREWRSMVLGEHLGDHKAPMLSRFYYSPGERNHLAAEVEEEAARLLALPALAELLERLKRVAPIDRLPLARPLAIDLAGLTVYGAPVLAFRDGNKVVFLEVHRAGAETVAPAAPLIHRYYALGHLKITPERVLSWHLDCAEGDITEPPVDLSGAIDRIRRSAAEMLDCLRPDGSAAGTDFAANPEACGNCRFRKYCSE